MFSYYIQKYHLIEVIEVNKEHNLMNSTIFWIELTKRCFLFSTSIASSDLYFLAKTQISFL